MAVIDPEKKRHFDERSQPYVEKIRKYQKAEVAALEASRAAPLQAAERLFELADDTLDLASQHLALNGISRSVLDLRDEEFLMEARKAIGRAILYVENVVTGKVDVPFSDYEENLAELSSVSAERKFFMARKIGLSISLLKYHYGNNTKWRWSFVDLEGRYTAIAKNLLDLKKAFVNNNASSPDYIPLLYHLRMVKDLLGLQADRYRERYALAAQRPDDLRLAMAYLSAQRQLYNLLGERVEAEELKKKYDVWTTAYETRLRQLK